MQSTDIDTTNPNLLNYYFKYDLTFLGYFIIQCVMNHRNLTGRSLRRRKQNHENIERPILHSEPLKSKHSNTENANLLDTKEIGDILKSLSLESNEIAKVYVENYSTEEDPLIGNSSESRTVYTQNSHTFGDQHITEYDKTSEVADPYPLTTTKLEGRERLQFSKSFTLPSIPISSASYTEILNRNEKRLSLIHI